MVYSMHYSNLISDFFLVNEFVSQKVQLTSRAMFFYVLKGGIDFLLDGIEKDSNNKGAQQFFDSILQKAPNSDQMMMSEQNHELSDFSLSVREKENTNYH